MALSIIKALKDVAQAFKVLPKYTPVYVGKRVTTSTDLVSTGVSQEIPANSYVCLTASAVWSHSKPVVIQVKSDSPDAYHIFEGYTEFQVASAPISFYTDRKCKLDVKAKYTSAATNLITLTGYIVTFGGGYCVTWLGGGLRAVIKAMLDGYRQFCKKHQDCSFCKAKQEVDEDRGKLWHYILQCEQVQRTAVNNGVRGSLHQNAYSCGYIIGQCKNAVCWNVQFRNLYKYEHDIRCGIKTAYRIYGYTYSLRQITPRGCCYA